MGIVGLYRGDILHDLQTHLDFLLRKPGGAKFLARRRPTSLSGRSSDHPLRQNKSRRREDRATAYSRQVATWITPLLDRLVRLGNP